MDLEKTKELKLNVMVRHDAERGVYVGQCLQFDVAVQAPSMEKLKQRFAHAFAAYVNAVNRDEVTARQAPRAFWDLYYAGEVDPNHFPIYVPSRDVRAQFSVTKNAPPSLEACA
jgi:hypothetical protein